MPFGLALDASSVFASVPRRKPILVPFREYKARRQNPTAKDGGSVENAEAIHRPCWRRFTESNTKLTSSD